MGNILRPTALSLLLAMCVCPATAQTGVTPRPVKKCDDATRAEFYGLWRDGRGTAQWQKAAYEAGKEFLRVCAGAEDDYIPYVRRWVERYEAVLRDYEANRAAKPDAAPVPQAPAQLGERAGEVLARLLSRAAPRP